MKRSIKAIEIVITMGIMLVSAYLLGTTQAETITVEKEVVKTVEVVPDWYIDTTTEEFYNNYVDMRTVTDFTVTNDGLQLYFEDKSGYYWER